MTMMLTKISYRASFIGKRFAEEIRSEYDNFGLMVDLSHFPLLHETIEESILPIKDYIHMHIWVIV